MSDSLSEQPAATDAAVALLLVAYGAVSGRLRSTPVSQAMVFVALGLLVGSRVLDKERSCPDPAWSALSR